MLPTKGVFLLPTKGVFLLPTKGVFLLPTKGVYFSFYTAVISPPISPLKAAALWGAPPVHFTLVSIYSVDRYGVGTEGSSPVALSRSFLKQIVLSGQDAGQQARGHCLTRAAAQKGLIGGISQQYRRKNRVPPQGGKKGGK